ncbi:GNAT family N-acetyltransferase [Consotaella salsifontis]|uniref:Ribosomal protein S18 acetylase RimI n=1 Tax=Consotaella salsifontis TaxID=1365950 RepID=A0A1T4P9Q3_9HYPH|nr:GNAT family N-acetyltransferase [Consotaella salsifontis]SJZ88111.1 Ribosomal protein S18 acetylase RimI [Consotaella salsifontis]
MSFSVDEIVFQRAKSSDVTEIVALLADDEVGRAREDPSLPLNDAYVQAFQAMDADPNQLLAVARLGERVVGTLQLTFIPGLSRMGSWRGQIEGVRIAAELRGSGLGGRMFVWAIEECRRRGCSLVQLTTDRQRPDAHRFYERLGFEASHLGYKLKL